VTDSPATTASGAPGDAVPVPLSLPAADLAEVTADIANAPVVRWLRALTSWPGTGRGVAEFARIPPADRAHLSALLGFDDAPRNERGLLVDIAVRWAVEANLLRLRTGTLRPAKRHLPLLDDPAALWFRPPPGALPRAGPDRSQQALAYRHATAGGGRRSGASGTSSRLPGCSASACG
jgi:hypothetical protein